jgi:membrane protease YdiL (CAAX protease family)
MTESISKWKALKWVILTTITLSGIIALIVTLFITAWYTEMRFAGTPFHGSPPAHVRNIAMVLGTVVGEWFTVWLWWFFFRKTASFSSLFQTRTNSPWTEFGIGVLVAGVLIFLATLMRPPIEPWPKLLIVLMSLSAGLSEEFLFRGFLISLIARAGWGWTMQILLSSLAFGLGHFYMGPWGIVWATFVGLLFAAITIRRGNVWVVVTAHFLVDLVVMLQLFSIRV